LLPPHLALFFPVTGLFFRYPKNAQMSSKIKSLLQEYQYKNSTLGALSKIKNMWIIKTSAKMVGI